MVEEADKDSTPLQSEPELAEHSMRLAECAMLMSTQKEAEAAYSADHTALPAPESYREAVRRSDSAD